MRYGLARAWRGSATALVALALAACATPQQGGATSAAKDDPAPPPLKTMSPLGSYLAALHAQQAHDYDSASQLMEKALADDPNNIDLVRRTFVLRVSDGHIAESVPLAQRLVEIDGNNGLPASVLLEADIKAGRFDAAAQRTQTIARAGPQRFAVPLLDAWIEAGRGNAPAAQAAIASMGDLQAIEPLRDLHLGLVTDYTNQIDAAQAAYQRLLAAEPQPTFRIVDVVGNFYERRGRSADAQKLYQQFASGGDKTGLAEMGLARIGKGTIPQPIVRTAQQGAAEAFFDIATLLNQRETVDASLIYARLALDLQPNLALAQLLAAEIREGEDRPADALALYRAVDPGSPLAWSARLRAALALDEVGQTDDAIAELKAMAVERPNDDDPLVELGDVLRSHTRYQEAAAAYDEAIKRHPVTDQQSWRLYYDRGVSLERSGQWPPAEADLKHALQLAPQEPLVLNYLGYSWIDKGENLSDALKMIQRAVELRPNDGYIVDSLGWAYYHLGDFGKATTFLERAIELMPEDPTINDHLGDVYWRTGRVNEARFQWRRALQFGPDEGDIKGIETKLDRGLQTTPQTMSGG